ncbi:MAG: hypothetical protein AAGA74_20460 [Pseudomonadota bacterium]
MNLSNRLKKLEVCTSPPEVVDAVIHVVYRRGETGPEPSGAAYARFVGAALPMLEKSRNETLEDFDARVDKIVSHLKDIKSLPETEQIAQKNYLAAEITDANGQNLAATA